MTEDQRDRPENPHLFAFSDRVELIVHQRPPAVLFQPSADQGHATSGDDHRLPGSSVVGFARLHDEEVAGLDAEGGDIGSGAEELVARVQRQLVWERNLLSLRGGVDWGALRDASFQPNDHDDLR